MKLSYKISMICIIASLYIFNQLYAGPLLTRVHQEHPATYWKKNQILFYQQLPLAVRWEIAEYAGFNTPENQWLPLQTAAHNNDVKHARILTICGANINHTITENPIPPLHYAIAQAYSSSHEQLAKKYIFINFINNQADLNLPDAQGNSPVHIAVQRMNFFALRTLIKNGANLNQKNNNGYTPLDEANKSTMDPTCPENQKIYQQICRLLKEHKAESLIQLQPILPNESDEIKKLINQKKQPFKKCLTH